MLRLTIEAGNAAALIRGVARRRLGGTPTAIDPDHSPIPAATAALADVLASV